MIGSLRGRILFRQPPFLMLEVQGVGYELEAPMSTFYALPETDGEVFLYTHLVVREDAQLLFGFSDLSQRDLFRSLLKINGIGPRVALAILSTLSAREFLECIGREDAQTLTRVPGIGKKTADRMIFDMRDKFSELSIEPDADSSSEAKLSIENPIQDAIGALMALGYKANEANKAVRAVEDDSPKRDDLIRNALQYLAKS